MAISITATPSSGAATKTAFRIAVTGLDDTNFASYNASNIPTEPAFTYYMQFSEGGLIKGRSHVFTPGQLTGTHLWDNVILPDAGTYTFSVHLASSGATLASVGVTAS